MISDPRTAQALVNDIAGISATDPSAILTKWAHTSIVPSQILVAWYFHRLLQAERFNQALYIAKAVMQNHLGNSCGLLGRQDRHKIFLQIIRLSHFSSSSPVVFTSFMRASA